MASSASTKGRFEGLGQTPAHSGFARPHQPDQGDGACRQSNTGGQPAQLGGGVRTLADITALRALLTNHLKRVQTELTTRPV